MSQTLGAGRRRTIKPKQQVARKKWKWRPRLLIRPARMRLRMTQAELARRLGTAPARVSEWESGRNLPEWDTLAAIAKALDLKILAELLDPNSRFDQDNPPA